MKVKKLVAREIKTLGVKKLLKFHLLQTKANSLQVLLMENQEESMSPRSGKNP